MHKSLLIYIYLALSSLCDKEIRSEKSLRIHFKKVVKLMQILWSNPENQFNKWHGLYIETTCGTHHESVKVATVDHVFSQ